MESRILFCHFKSVSLCTSSHCFLGREENENESKRKIHLCFSEQCGSGHAAASGCPGRRYRAKSFR